MVSHYNTNTLSCKRNKENHELSDIALIYLLILNFHIKRIVWMSVRRMNILNFGNLKILGLPL